MEDSMFARWLLVPRFVVAVMVVVVVAVAAPKVGHAQSAPASSTAAEADSLFEGGRALLDAGKIAEACAAFDNSEKLDPRPTTLLNLAACREKNNQLATARALFAEAGRLAQTMHQDKLIQVALNHARKLDPRLSKLTISVPSEHLVPGLEVLRGAERIDAAGWNHAVPVDGGSYTITARALGRTTWTVTRTIKPEDDTETIEVPKLAETNPTVATAPPAAPVKPVVVTVKPPAPVAVAVKPPAPEPVAPPRAADSHAVPPPAAAAATAEPPDTKALTEHDNTPVPETPGPSRPSYLVPLAVGAGAVVLGAIAFGFNVAGNTLYRNSTTEYARYHRPDIPDELNPFAEDAEQRHDKANSRRYAAEAFGGAALVGAGVAVYLYVRTRGERQTETTAIAPVAGPQLTGLAVVGRW
jgi:hypothetical protein